MKYDLMANKRHDIAFYQTAYLGNPRAAVEEWDSIQAVPVVSENCNTIY